MGSIVAGRTGAPSGDPPAGSLLLLLIRFGDSIPLSLDACDARRHNERNRGSMATSFTNPLGPWGSVVAVALYLISLGISMILSVRNVEKRDTHMTTCATWISNQSGNIAAGMAATLLLGEPDRFIASNLHR
jgi:hypothetical protein